MKSKWPKARLDECADIVSGATPSTSNKAYWNGDICWATPKDLSQLEGAYISDTPRKLTRAGLENCGATILPVDSVLFSSRAPIGHVAVNTLPMATNQGFKSFVPSRHLLHAKFLYWWLRTNRAYLEGLGNGATFKEVSKNVVSRVEIALPPPAEQRRIADVLDRAEALRAKRRAALAQLDSLTQSLFLDLFGDPATNPKGWPKITLGKIIEFVGGSQPPRETFTYEPSPDTIRLVQIRDFKSDDFRTYIPRKLARRFFEADDVMIGRYGPPVFQILRGLSGSYNVALMKAVPRGDVLKDFIFHLLKEQRLHSYVVARSERTAGQTGVNLELLEKYPAYLPPIQLQHEFGRRVNAVEKLRAVQRASLAELDALFATLQHRAFRGELFSDGTMSAATSQEE